MTLSLLGGDPEAEQAILVPFPPGWGPGGGASNFFPVFTQGWGLGWWLRLFTLVLKQSKSNETVTRIAGFWPKIQLSWAPNSLV